MIRVLHCVVNMNRGGYETFLMNVYRVIDRTEIQFDFIVSNPGVFDEEIKSLGGKIYYTPFITKVGPFQYAKSIKKIFKENPYYIVHSHMDKFSGMVVKQAKKAGVPVRIAHAHNTRNEGGFAFQVVKNYYGWKVNKYATNLFACSKSAADWMYKKRSPEAVIIHNGIEMELFQCSESEKTIIKQQLKIESKFVVGHVGRFTHQKNHTFLIDIFKEILSIKDNAMLVLVGKGALMQKMKDKARSLEILDQVIFLGEREDINFIVNGFDRFVFPSLHEGLGISLIEAQAAGVPCIVSDAIPSEAKVSENYTILPLSLSAKEWAKVIVEKDDVNKCKSNIFKYEVSNTANQLFKLYRLLNTNNTKYDNFQHN